MPIALFAGFFFPYLQYWVHCAIYEFAHLPMTRKYFYSSISSYIIIKFTSFMSEIVWTAEVCNVITITTHSVPGSEGVKYLEY